MQLILRAFWNILDLPKRIDKTFVSIVKALELIIYIKL